MAVIMHINSMDVALQIIRKQYIDDKRVRYKAQWINLGYTGNPWPVSSIVSVEIKRENLSDWKPIRINKPRTKPGLPEGDL